ncbi:SurA-like protein [Scopulibacillus darangshiensis]|uniref:SurA-like protein n=1 Tax=Scopulibacillus darangshiensis TaxID=442528 RepID=A0A4R2P269_9BACL|nr:SurA N-terminal domain-containing protein [Scopulibacillus darangshiensis]TCP28712.1 SurA-like protein [Scopulibacillus darangshiensis]
MFRKLALVTLAPVLAFGLTACGNNDDKKSSDQPKQEQQKPAQTQNKKQQVKGLVSEDKTVATVNDEKIMGNEYNMMLKQLEQMAQQQGQDINDKKVYKQVKDQAISSLVGNKLLLQDADKKGYKASEKKIDDQYNKIKGQFKTEKEFNALLKKNHLSKDQLKQQISDQLVSDQYIKNEVGPVKVSDEEIQSFYKQISANQKKAPDLEKVKPQIKQQLEKQKTNEKLGKIVDQLKKKSDVKVNV